MDRRATIGYILIFIIIAVTFYLNQKNAYEIEKIQKKEDSLKVVSKRKQNTEPFSGATSTDSLAQSDTVTEHIYTFENSKLKVFLSNKGGFIRKAWLKDFKTFDKKPLYLLQQPNDTFNYKIYFKDGVVNTSKLNFEPVASGNSGMAMQAATHGGFIKLTYGLIPGTFRLNYTLELINLQKQIPESQNFIDFKWVSNISLIERTITDERATTTIFYKYKSDDDVENLSESKSEEKKLQKGLEWVCYKQKFFNTTLISKTGFQDIAGISTEVPPVENRNSIKKLSAACVIPYGFKPNEKYEFEFFIGPNHYQTLDATHTGLQKIISLGFFGWVSKYMIIPIFNWLAGFIVNFGLVILCLTLIIKLILFPLVYKSYVSSAKMRILKPEIDEIKEKYGNDMTRIQQENMKLYKRAGVSPLGGCFPMLLQLPILLAMFRFFPASIELRQKSFLWASDLSSYDSILELGFNIPFYGSHISLFTLLMTLSTLLYTRMNNQLTGVSGQMKWISYTMPVLFLGFFNNYASGLTYYYFLGNMITFVQNVLIRKFFVDEVKLHKQIEENKKKPVVIKKSGFQKRLEEMAKKNSARTAPKKVGPGQKKK